MIRNTPLLLLLVLSWLFMGCDSLFGDKTYLLNVTVSPSGVGTVTPGNGSYKQFESISLQANALNGWIFVRWEGDWNSTQNPSQISLNRDYTIVGVFEKRSYPLTVTTQGEGRVEETVVAAKSYPFQTVVELRAIPSTGWEFASWSGDITGSQNPQTITVSDSKTVTATFQRKSYPLNITIEGQGTVQEKVVTAKAYPFQTVVELTPVPATGWEFSSWGGDLSGNQQPQTITVTETKNVVARFQKRSYPLNITIVGQGEVDEKVIPSKTYPFQTVVELTPVPAPGWKFNGWSGDLSGTTVPGRITVNDTKNVTATFIVIAFLAENGVTIMCPNGKGGEIGIVNGIEYESVDRDLLEQRRNSGADLTKVCVSNVTNLDNLFEGRRFNQPIGNWDVSSVQTMVRLFWNSTFNQNINEWDVSQVRYMNQMFALSPFNQPIDSWNVGKVYEMRFMFSGTPFNQPIGNWNVSRVYQMQAMFSDSPFNQPIGNWNVKNVGDMRSMFSGTPFNQPIINWDVSNVTNMSWMFGSSEFNQDIGGWNVSKVTNMSSMFTRSKFNQPIATWNVSLVSDMSEMFSESIFNQPIGNWNVSNVYRMNGMFRGSVFNHAINNWDVSSVNEMQSMFEVSMFNQSIDKWNVAKVYDMKRMFSESPFNQPIGNWNTTSLRTMESMFRYTPFNQSIGNWNVKFVENMNELFYYSKFNQPIGNWNVSNTENMSRLFSHSDFDQFIGEWDVSQVRSMIGMFHRGRFNQSLKKWCVTNLFSEPHIFSNFSPLTQENKPIWGTCPPR